MEKLIYGIDLGTTYSCIAVLDDAGKAEVLDNSEGEKTTPSVVYFESEESVVVGKAAKNSSKVYPERTASFIKREMGNPDYVFEVDGHAYRPEEISSFTLRKLVNDASAIRGGEPIIDVIITCPAYFGINHREATKAAGELAGLTVHRVINEPTAAAFYYGVDGAEDQTVLVYDLGGGTFDITLIEVKDGGVHVVHTDGDHNLGGKDWDDQLVNYLAEQFMAQFPDKGDPRDDPESLQSIVIDAEDIKKGLTSREKYAATVSHNGSRARVEVRREIFAELTGPLMERTVELTRGVIEQGAQRGHSQIDRLLLVGGSSFMPQVAASLAKAFDIPTEMFEPNLAVAKGAALIGAQLMAGELLEAEVEEITGKSVDGDFSQIDETTLQKASEEAAKKANLRISGQAFHSLATMEFTDVCSKSFGVVTTELDGSESVAFLIHNNTPVPQQISQTFGTLAKGQSSIHVRIMEQSGQTESSDLSDNRLVTDGQITGLPPGLPAESPVEITFALEADGRLDVTAKELSSGQELRLQAKLEGVMGKDEIKQSKGLLLKKQVS